MPARFAVSSLDMVSDAILWVSGMDSDGIDSATSRKKSSMYCNAAGSNYDGISVGLRGRYMKDERS
jgi:hypothetical protein